jgi:hypothetical protein
MLTRHTHYIAKLLDDPLTQMVMQADLVDRGALEEELRELACRLESAKRGAVPRRLPASREPILSASPGTLPTVPLAVAMKAGRATCGACCS